MMQHLVDVSEWMVSGVNENVDSSDYIHGKHGLLVEFGRMEESGAN